jgi:hypothetical protein
MSFETTVLTIVKSVLKSDNEVEFFNGTLFVECSTNEAVKIETALNKELDCGIIMSRQSVSETAYDFV